MEITLSINGYDNFLATNFNHENLNEFVPALKALGNSIKNEDYSYKIINETVNSENKTEMSIEISPSEIKKNEIKGLLVLCEEKEKKYTELKANIETDKNKITLDKKQIDTFFVNSIPNKSQFYHAIVGKIVTYILKSNSFTFNKEIKDIKSNVSRMRKNVTFCLFYKIFLIQGNKGITNLYKYNNIFSANNHNISILAESFMNLLKVITKQLIDDIIVELNTHETFIKNQKEYLNYIYFVQQYIILFPIIKYMDDVNYSVVFSGSEVPISVGQSESNFVIIRSFLQLFPFFDKIKENPNNEKVMVETFCLVLSRDLELNKKFNYFSGDIAYNYLLYED